MMTMTTEADVLGVLFDQRHESGTPKIGCREVELVSGNNHVWRLLKKLREEGKIVRRNGWCWLTEEHYETMLEG